MASSSAGEPGAGAARAVRTSSRPKANPGWGLVVVGGLLGVLGAFLTWATINYGGVATHTSSGVSAGRDGKITLVLAVLVLAVTAGAFLGWVGNWLRPALTILGLVIAFVAMADLLNSPSVGSEEQARLRTPAHVTSSNGIGAWLTLIAGILVVIGVALVARYSQPRPAGAHAARPAPAAAGDASAATPAATSAAAGDASAGTPAATSAAAGDASAATPAATSAAADDASAATPAAANVLSPAAEPAGDTPSHPDKGAD